MIFLKLQNTSSSFQFPPQWEKKMQGENVNFQPTPYTFPLLLPMRRAKKWAISPTYLSLCRHDHSLPLSVCWRHGLEQMHTHTNPHPWGRQENCDAGAERKKGAYVTEVATRRCSARFRKYSIQSQSLFTFTHKVELKDAHAVGMNRSEIRASDVGRIWKKVERKSVQIRYSI